MPPNGLACLYCLCSAAPFAPPAGGQMHFRPGAHGKKTEKSPCFLPLAFSQKSGKTVTVKENNKTVYSGSLYENKTIKLAGNTVEIKNGKVRVSSADCKNQICVNHKPISKKGESIICLPNKVLAEVE